MLIYGETFKEHNAESLSKLREMIGEDAFRVAIEMSPHRNDDPEPLQMETAEEVPLLSPTRIIEEFEIPSGIHSIGDGNVRI